MSYMLPHLHNGWQVDQAILSEEDRVVVIRFGHDWDPTCMKMDEVLYSIAEKKQCSVAGLLRLRVAQHSHFTMEVCGTFRFPSE
uniref:Thioredoxin-like 4A n=1 Tax=Cyanistes caeruleus TaxID=156563 RepID=A0A8C0U2B3_CYACU